MDQQYLSGRQPRPPAERRTQARLRVQLPARGPDGQSWRVHDISEPLEVLVGLSPRLLFAEDHLVLNFGRVHLARLRVAQMIAEAAERPPDGLNLTVVGD